jgi:2-polyprenyl-3-methyl-5-hydroxy-6-metoxy-1,4-benzoquinol methylase
VLVVDLVGPDQRVLDVGCSTGYLGKELVARGCTVDGVEVDPEAAEAARAHLRTVTQLDLDRDDLATALDGQQYDRIVFADVLEHLMRPREVLESAVRLLAPGGKIVISIPNVAHGSLRLGLMQGRWQYRDTGLLDRTHIRFFTRSTLADLVQGAGLSITRLRSTTLDPLHSEIELDQAGLPEALVHWVRTQEDAFNYQYVLLAEPGDSTEVPPLEPAEVLPTMDEVRPGTTDLVEIGALLAERAELRRKVLNLRDHAVGAEAELGQARRDRERAEAERDAALHDTRVLRASASWKIGQLAVSPVSKARRLLRGRA